MTAMLRLYLLMLFFAIGRGEKDDDCTKRSFGCKCGIKNERKSISCIHKNLIRPPINGFPFPKGTQVADLSYNKFYGLQHYAFNQSPRDMNELVELNMSSNYIQRISTRAFIHIDNLLILDLSHNKIGSLEPETFKNMKKLEILYLHHNQIRTLREYTFKGLNSLKILDLSYGQLSHIEWWAFSLSGKDAVLNLKDNSLTKFHTNYIFTPSKFSGNIDLGNNPIICDCGLKRIYEDSKYSDTYNLTCSGPPTLRGIHFSALLPEDFQDCREILILTNGNKTVVGAVNKTTTLSCETIPGPQVKHWSIISRSDNLTELPDRFTVSQSETWVNLTIVNTQKSDEGQYLCEVSERLYGSLRSMYSKWSLIVTEDVEPTVGSQGGVQEHSWEDVPEVEVDGDAREKGDEELPEYALWLLSVLAIVIVLSIVMVFVFVWRRTRKNTTKYIYAPGTERGSHLYEDVDEVLARLSQRPLPRTPAHDYASVGPLTQKGYLKHEMIFARPPPVRYSQETDDGDKSVGSYDNELYLGPKPSPTPSQIESMFAHSASCITVLPLFEAFQSTTKDSGNDVTRAKTNSN